jgi:hypothetical protein
MTIAVIVGICIVLLILAFLAPRLSRGPEGATAGESASAGRRGRSKMPM